MTVSMRVMSAGDGYKYLLKTVVAADGNRPLSTPLTRYYMEEGTPPGRWLGAGVAALGKGEIQVGDRVSEDQLQLLMGTGCDPITGDKLGLGFPEYKSQDERIEADLLTTEGGALLALSDEGLMLRAWAPGQWRTVGHVTGRVGHRVGPCQSNHG